MICSYLLLKTLFLLLGSSSFSEIQTLAKRVAIGNTLKLQCPVSNKNLHLIKWYKDGQEFCRVYYRKNGSYIFKQVAQKTTQSKKKTFCKSTNVDLEVVNITSTGYYTCHAVLESAQKRRIVKRSASILVYPKRGPIISGIKSSYEEGEIIQANCTASPSNPPPSLVWYINGVSAYGWSMFSYPCSMTGDGLCVLKLGLRISATRKIFPTGIASFVCEAGILALPPKRAFVTSKLIGVNNTGNVNLLYGGLFGTSMAFSIILVISVSQ